MYKDQFCKLNDVTVRYWRTGKDTSNSIILLHGIGSAIEAWETLIPYLSTHFQVYAFDFSGFGQSDKPHLNYSPVLFSELLRKFIDFHQIKEPSLIGHSMGGEIALRYLLENNDNQVQKLVLINSAGFGATSKWFSLIAHPLLAPIATSILHNDYLGSVTFRKLYGLYLSEIAIKNLSQHWKNKAVLHAYISYMSSIKDEMKIPHLERIKQPCLILWGRNDKILTSSQAYLAKSILRNSKLHVLPQGGHSVHSEFPQIVNPLIMDFLLHGL